MPARVVFHKGDILALDRLHQNHGRLSRALIRMECLKCLFECHEVMSVNRDDSTAERLEFLINRCRVHDICRSTVDLKTVYVHRNAEIVELIMCGKHRRLPHLPLGKLAIAEESIDIDVLPEILCPFCHPCRRRNPLPERARGHIDTQREVHIRMSLEARANMTQCQEFVHREESTICECCIEAGSNMPLRENETVTIRIVRILWINSDLLIVEIGKILRR